MKRYISLIIILFYWISAFSQTADKYLIKAGMLTQVKQYDEALAAISQSASSGNKNYQRIMADIYYGRKDYTRAIEIYTDLESAAPGSYRLHLAKCYAGEGNLPKTKENLDVYFLQKNKMPISKIINDEVFLKFRNNTEWQNMWQKIDYSDAELRINLVKTAAENGYDEYFTNRLDEALNKYPSNPELLFQQSQYLFDKKMYDAAEKAIDHSIAKSASDKYYYHRSRILQKSNKLKEALNSVNQAIARNPFEVGYYLTRIDLNRSLKNQEEIAKDLELIEFCLPESNDVQLAKIKTEAERGNYLNAINGLTDLIEKDQTNKDYYILRGNMDLKVERLQDADEDFGMALDLNPGDPDANLGKGIARHKLDDRSAACYYWQKASNEGSREALEYLNKYCGKE